MSIFEKRRKKLMEIMEQKGICAAVFTPSTDYRYLTGSARQPAQRITALILTQDHQRLLLPGFEAGNEKALAEELELVPYSDLEDAAQLTAGLLPTKGCAAAGREMGAGFLLALLKLTGGIDDNIVLGAGDLYVTVFGGRTRKIGTLLGRGLSFEAAMQELSGVTLESIVIATRTARAVRALIERGKAQKEDFPLLMHIDDIINHGAQVAVPWNAFETETIL